RGQSTVHHKPWRPNAAAKHRDESNEYSTIKLRKDWLRIGDHFRELWKQQPEPVDTFFEKGSI
ncbi:MAG: hypothetical protein L7V86_02675, partial [Verrucomicrobiales bacterium]|nr:hypothetical protein [Verrucomicrobiales bacterium]